MLNLQAFFVCVINYYQKTNIFSTQSLQQLIYYFSLQSLNKEIQFMYYVFPDFSSFQPTFIFFSPVITNFSQIQFQPFDSEITEDRKIVSFGQKDQLSTQNNVIAKAEVKSIVTQEPMAQEERRISRKKSVSKIENKTTEVYVQNPKVQKPSVRKKKSTSQLFFGIEWKNQNRNIIPNIMNQMLSFVQKKHKSEWLIERLFNKYPHDEQWSVSRYFCYMKKMKASMGHYINESELNAVIVIQQPEFEIYTKEEQLFYLKICRITVEYFFKTESILISLTSKRMSHEKRKAHLIARRALLYRVQQILENDQ